MAKILCIESATTNCSVALAKNGKLITFREENRGQYSHAEKLHLFIAEVLKEAAVELHDLDAIAVSKGPGSYTGLRIGVSAAKGLCFALDVPLISISTLKSIASQVEVLETDVVVPMLDARRMEVYSAVFDAEGNQIRETRAEILDESSFRDYLEKGRIHFIGDGTEKFQNILNHPNAVFVPDGFPSAKEMVCLAETKFENSQFEDVAYFEPYYLKDFVGGKKKG